MEPSLKLIPTPACSLASCRSAKAGNFVCDIVDRVEALASTFDRRRELCELYVRLDRELWELIEAQRVSDPVRVQFEYPDELRQGMDRCQREAQALVTFAYYELSSLASLLRDWLSPPQSHLEYLVGVRHNIRITFAIQDTSLGPRNWGPGGGDFFNCSKAREAVVSLYRLMIIWLCSHGCPIISRIG